MVLLFGVGSWRVNMSSDALIPTVLLLNLMTFRSRKWSLILGPRWTLCRIGEVGNGLTIKMWEDARVALGVLIKDLAFPHLDSIWHLPLVSNFLNEDGTWNWTLLSINFPPSYLKQDSCYPPFSSASFSDCCIWSGTTSGIFSISSMYGILN